jgi:hypothetical protein
MATCNDPQDPCAFPGVFKIAVEKIYVEVKRKMAKTGQMVERVTDYCDDVEDFRRRIEKKGGSIIHVGASRMVETMSVYF